MSDKKKNEKKKKKHNSEEIRIKNFLQSNHY